MMKKLHDILNIVDGGWRSGEWSVCKVTAGAKCGNKTRTKTKYCDDPLPLNDGKNCACNDKSSDEIFCNGITATITEACGIEPCPTTGT